MFSPTYIASLSQAKSFMEIRIAMRFAIATSYPDAEIFKALLSLNWKPVKLFTQLDEMKNCRTQAIDIAQSERINIQLSRITTADLKALAAQGCDILVVAGYKWLIPSWHEHIPYAINFHPSPLPEGRGPWPFINALLEERKTWGVTCHKLDANFDTGDILAQEFFELSANECHETLLLKCQWAAIKLANRVVENFSSLWSTAQPQVGGSYWANPMVEYGQLDFSQTVEKILLKVRAFGLIGTRAMVADKLYYIRQASGWVESHTYPPGSLICVSGTSFVVAASDGYIVLLEWMVAPA